MGWESGCFPASVMITWTGLWPSEEFREKRFRGRHQERVGETQNKAAIINEKKTHTLSKTYNGVTCRDCG